MKSLFFGLLTLGLLTQARATEAPVGTTEATLDTELQKLNTEANRPPEATAAERLYAVQSRYSPMRHRHEISLGGARNFTSDSYIISQQLDLAYRFYLANRWFVGLTGSYVFNDLSGSGRRLFQDEAILPDATFTKYRGDLSLGYHLFYGKFRLSMDQVFYFDQYISLGPGVVRYLDSTEYAVVGDVGLVAWFGQHFSARIGVKDFFVKEVRRKSAGHVHNLLGHLTFGYVF